MRSTGGDCEDCGRNHKGYQKIVGCGYGMRGPQMAGLRNDSGGHVEKNEGDGREFLRMVGGCRQTMSDVATPYTLHNKQCA